MTDEQNAANLDLVAPAAHAGALAAPPKVWCKNAHARALLRHGACMLHVKKTRDV